MAIDILTKFLYNIYIRYDLFLKYIFVLSLYFTLEYNEPFLIHKTSKIDCVFS